MIKLDHTKTIKINDISFTPLEGVEYKHDYIKVAELVANKTWDAKSAYRELIKNDLWFIVFFVMGLDGEKEGDPGANHSFVIDACREVEEGPKTKTLDLWAREHYKSTIITKAETIQKILSNPKKRIAIFSHTRPIAKGFLRSIKLLFEESKFLKTCFPDVLYVNPQSDSPKWSEDDGIIVKRDSTASERTLAAGGLLEGMPTTTHFTDRIYDDIETDDLVKNPDMIKKLISKFNLSSNLGTFHGTERIIGTTYHHAALLVYCKDKKDIHGKQVYTLRKKTATHNDLPNGKPVLLSQERLDTLRASEYEFNCQQMLDPTPAGVRTLDSTMLKDIDPKDIPNRLYKFMVVDAAGDDKTGGGDAWGIHIVGVEPSVDEIGASNIYILDSIISPLRETEAPGEIAKMYMRNGMIMQVGVEKVALSTTEVHVKNALKAQGRHISIDNKTLVILRPAGRNKVTRIERALAWPFDNSKIHISTNVPMGYRDRLRDEMDKFPFWHDDGLDALSYVYDMIKDFTFSNNEDVVPIYEPACEAIGY